MGDMPDVIYAEPPRGGVEWGYHYPVPYDEINLGTAPYFRKSHVESEYVPKAEHEALRRQKIADEQNAGSLIETYVNVTDNLKHQREQLEKRLNKSVPMELVEPLLSIVEIVMNNHGTTICMNSDDDLEKLETAVKSIREHGK